MESLLLEETKFTPAINMDVDTGIISIVGRSYPEDTLEFYQPVFVWLNTYFETDVQNKTIVNLEIIYFNSSSSKLFSQLFDILVIAKHHNDIEVNWFYDKENESALEAGEDFIEDFDELDINLVEK